MDGYTWSFGIGNISLYTSKIEICEMKNPNDYKKVTDWIDKN